MPIGRRESPGSEEVKIRAKAVSVNPTDFKARRGGNQGAVPIILGRDTAGVVESVGGRGRYGILPRR